MGFRKVQVGAQLGEKTRLQLRANRPRLLEDSVAELDSIDTGGDYDTSQPRDHVIENSGCGIDTGNEGERLLQNGPDESRLLDASSGETDSIGGHCRSLWPPTLQEAM